MNVSSPTGVPDDDAFWKRPDPDSASLIPPPAAQPPVPGPPTYSGPPRTAAPNPQWRPPTIAQPTPPRHLPSQNLDAVDRAENSARTITFGVGLVAGSIALILMCLLCGRAIF